MVSIMSMIRMVSVVSMARSVRQIVGRGASGSAGVSPACGPTARVRHARTQSRVAANCAAATGGQQLAAHPAVPVVRKVRMEHRAARRARGGGGRARRAQPWRRLAGLTAAGVAAALVGCAAPYVPPFPEPLRPPMEGAEPAPPAPVEEPTLGVTAAPGVVAQKKVAERLADDIGADLRGEPIAVSFHNLPLSAFINEVFAKQLGFSFHIAPELQGREDLVTLKLTEPVAPGKLFATARAVLADYGIDIARSDELLTFAARPDDGGDVSLLVSGRALPEVPATHRTIFQLVPLRAARALFVADMLEDMLGKELRAAPDLESHLLTLRGPARLVAEANALIDVLDQPMLSGRQGAVIAPSAAEVGPLAADLRNVLSAEGYQAHVGLRQQATVMLLPLASTNKLVVFAGSAADLAHVEEWARLLDDQSRQTVEDGVFTREVRNTQATAITETLSGLYEEGSVIVDKNRNIILFRGSGTDWGRLAQIIDELDKPVASVLIEVLIAEVALTDMHRSGIEFFLRGALGDKAYKGGTIGRLVGQQSGGLSIALNRGGDARAVLNAFYEDSRVVIRSRPSLVVKSGGTATLSAGNNIPTVAQRVESNTNLEGASNILQQVQYRETGLDLQIEPVVQANGLVDITVSQSLSEARPTAATSQAGSPTILRRELTTTMTLRDGASVLMGGLISDSNSGGQTGVPLLGKLPGVGRLFRVDSRNRDRTELLILVTPYVLADHAAGRELTERLKAELRLHKGLTD